MNDLLQILGLITLLMLVIVAIMSYVSLWNTVNTIQKNVTAIIENQKQLAKIVVNQREETEEDK